MPGPVAAPHAAAVADVALALESDPRRGLSAQAAQERLTVIGPNAIERRRRPPYLALAARQLIDPLIALLVAAAVVSLVIRERVEAVAIAAIVLLNGVLGFTQEVGAERAVLALRETLRRTAAVIREGREQEVPAEEVVPGDLLVLREGERVPADARLVGSEGLAVDESALTGESVPVDKGTEPVDVHAPLAERFSLVFAGTAVTRGSGRALVTATGPRAEMGQVAHLAERAKSPPTPLQRRLGGLSRLMVAAAVVITALLAGLRLWQGAQLEEAFLLGVSVAVAAVPEGLAATVTIALALGARRMAARGAIVRRLLAVETLGSATVIASDKTGTLTENRLRLHAVAPAAAHDERRVLTTAVLASTAELIPENGGGVRVAGDPVEGAFLLGAIERRIDPAALRTGRTLLGTVPFDAERKRMTVLFGENGAVHAYMKGAPEIVLERSVMAGQDRRALEALAQRWAADGLRVLAVAERVMESVPQVDEQLEQDFEPVGLVVLQDPLRQTAAAAVADARTAGLSVRILTGDHPATAGAIARQLGVPQTAVRARVTPRDKLDLVTGLQQQGEVVAVTGDGVNDAPALRRADVGVAMGRSGTEVAREASDVVLTDDDFSTIVAAIREGRAIADNLRKFVAFLLSANFGEVLLFAAAVASGLGAPMTVVQVLTVNLLTDGLPAVALARDSALPDVMRRGPQRGDRLFEFSSWAAIALVGGLVGVAALGAFLVGKAQGGDGQTMAFVTIAVSELAVVFAVRSPLRPAWREPRNPALGASVAASAVLLMLAIYVPPLQGPFGTVPLEPAALTIACGMGLLPFVVVEVAKAALRRFAPLWAQRTLRGPG